MGFDKRQNSTGNFRGVQVLSCVRYVVRGAIDPALSLQPVGLSAAGGVVRSGPGSPARTATFIGWWHQIG